MVPKVQNTLCFSAHGLYELMEKIGLQGKEASLLRLLDASSQMFFQGLLKSENVELAVGCLVRTRDRSCQGLPDILRQDLGILGGRSLVGECLGDGLQIPYGDLFIDEVLEWRSRSSAACCLKSSVRCVAMTVERSITV